MNALSRARRLHDSRRSPRWPEKRREHLEREPVCRACGGTKKLEVHHKQPFHLHPELELADSNLITLCEANGHDCHFVFGHFHNWKLINPNVEADVEHYRSEHDAAHKGA